VAPGLFVLVGDLEWELDNLSALTVDPELTLADLHLLDSVHSHACMIFHQLDDTLVGEVLHTENSHCEFDTVRDIAEPDRVELAFSYCLHLARGSHDTDLIQTVAAGCLLDPGHLGADVVLGAACGHQLFDGRRNERAGPPWLVAFSCHNGAVDDALFECKLEELSDDAAVL